MNHNRTFFIVADVLLLFLIAALVALVMNKEIHPRQALKKAFVALKHKAGAALRGAAALKPSLPGLKPGSGPAAPRASYLRLEASVLVDSKLSHTFHPGLLPAGRDDFVFSSTTGAVFRFSAKLRTVTAAAENGFEQATPLIPYGGRFLVRDRSSRFFLVDPATMNVRPYFLYAGGRAVFGLAGIGDANADGTDDIVVSDASMQVACVDGRNFTTRWSFNDASDLVLNAPVGLPINADRASDFAFVSQDGIVYGIDGRSGWVLWKQPVQETVKDSLRGVDINGDGGKELIFSSEQGNLFCFSRLGAGLWKLAMGSKIAALAFGDLNGDKNTDIVVCLENGRIIGLNAISQLKFWEFAPERPPLAGTLTCADLNGDRKSDLLFGDVGQTIYAVDGATGNLLGRLPVAGGGAASGFIKVRKDVFFLTQDGHMDIVRLDGRK
jgi:outer membrane protein assembly factor BamB